MLPNQVSSGSLSISSNTYLSCQRPDCLIEATPHHSRMAHGLSALVIAVVLVRPIVRPHEEELEQDWIGEVLSITSKDLFRDMTGVSPQPIVPVALHKDIVVPTIVIRSLLSRQRQAPLHMTRYLEGRSVPHTSWQRQVPPTS